MVDVTNMESQTGGEKKFVKLDGMDDPDRCQTVLKNQQCMFKAVPGTTHCPRHGGTKPAIALEKKNFRNLQLTQWGARVKEFGDNPEVKSLRDEIGLLRLILENLVNKCKDTDELIFYNQKITDLILKVEKLVSSAHKLEMSMGMMLDKTSVVKIGTSIAEIISEYVEDPDDLEIISNRIIEIILSNTGETK